ncbi:MAG: transcription elongation factor GreA [Pseudomonadota bacterium]
MTKKVPLTARGAELLREELRKLKYEDRPRVIEAIAEAREHGDLKENAEYHAAREQQSFMEGRIAEIESTLSLADIIDVTKMTNNGRVVFGATVHLYDPDEDEKRVYRIVGEDEADVKQGLISVSSPIARALIGKNQDDEVEVQAPGGVRVFEIERVEYL